VLDHLLSKLEALSSIPVCLCVCVCVCVCVSECLNLFDHSYGMQTSETEVSIGLVSIETFPLDLQSLFLPCLYTVFLLGVCVLMSSSYKNTKFIGLETTHIISF
jgi:hypothetical protein